MFDEEVEAARGSAALLVDLVAANHAAEKRHGCRRLVLAAVWADAHGDPTAHPVDESEARPVRRSRPDLEGLVRLGGLGTPLVAETCPAELGLAQQLSPGSARVLIADALDLRHRLPRLWERVVAGEVHAWKARTVAVRSRYLGLVAVAELDRLITPRLELVSWARFEKILDAMLLQVDPAAYSARVAESKARRGVWAGEAAAGLRTLIIRATQGDGSVFLAAVNRVADLLADEGDEDGVDVRRSKAVGILGNPAAALDLLHRHAGQSDVYDDPWGYGPDPSETGPWQQASAAGWADPHARRYHRPDPADPGYQAGQQPPPDEDDPPEPAGPRPDPAETEGSKGASADIDPAADDAAGPAGPAGTRLLPNGGLPLRPVTRADRNASRPRVQIVFHLTDEAVRARQGVVRTDAGPITLDELRQFLTDTDANITIRPVFDPAAVAAVDSYEIPLELRRAMDVRNPASVFPYSSSSGRTDFDHTRPWRRGGPPGQTSLGNLGPLTRPEHRAKTVGGWQARQPEPGIYLWRSPHGWIALTTNQGTLMLGTSPYAQKLWHDAAPIEAAA
ncbi:MAG TPA: DUF222 domain-containing protein [Actinomycetota bacterium]|nr:DUF222 domain-containing protein [Actinomycetota bacterium]